MFAQQRSPSGDAISHLQVHGGSDYTELSSDHGASMRNKIQIFKDYKFVLTFENNNVTDYVSEKMINVLQVMTSVSY